MRVPHLLKHNKGTELPSAAVWVDTETREKRISKVEVSHHLTQGMACYSRTRNREHWCEPEWLRFTTRKRFWDWLIGHTRAKTKLYVFAHNWNFDAAVLNLFSELPKRGWTLTKAVIEGPPVILQWRQNNATIIFLDTLNWWRTKLEKIGDSVGLPKLKFPSKRASRATWNTYNRRDVEIIYRAIREWWAFLKQYDLGSFAPTLASQSMRAFRHRFMSHEIAVHVNQECLKLERDSYHGGRVECFRIGRVKGPVRVYDVNSMYPFVMRDNVFPARLRLHTVRTNLGDLRRWLDSYCVIARVKLETRRNLFAHVHQERLVFPVGRFIEPLTTPELRDALDHDEVKDVLEIAIYDPEPIFKQFVTELYALRLAARAQGNPIQDGLLKILMNSLYGKFAQRGERWEISGKADDFKVRQWVELDYELGTLVSYRTLSGVLQTKHREGESSSSIPAIASHVTAYARHYLASLVNTVGASRVVYIDTDSLFVIGANRGSTMVSENRDQLGGLKLEATYPWVNIRGPKDYGTPTKEVCKGIRDPTNTTDDKTFIQDQWSSLTGLMSRGDLSAPRVKQVTKVLARVYRKGTVDARGYVHPLELREW